MSDRKSRPIDELFEEAEVEKETPTEPPAQADAPQLDPETGADLVAALRVLTDRPTPIWLHTTDDDYLGTTHADAIPTVGDILETGGRAVVVTEIHPVLSKSGFLRHHHAIVEEQEQE